MDLLSTSEIEVRGPLDERDLQAACPQLAWAGPADGEAGEPAGTVRLKACTDQSGLMGLLRQLHNRGIVLVSVRRAGAK